MLCRRFTSIRNKGIKNYCFQFVQCMSSGVTKPLDFQEMPSPRGLPIIGTALSLIIAGSAPKLHLYVDNRHKQLGSIYKEKIGPVSCVFLSNPDEMRAVFSAEGKYPVHLLPEPWMVYNEKFGCSRGLFFMDGEEWLHFRRILNKHLLKGDLSWIESSCSNVSDNLINVINSELNSCETLENKLYKWSLDVIVAIMLGPEKYKLNYKLLEPLIEHLASTIHDIFQTTSKLSLIPASLAAKYNLKRWKNFVYSVDTALLSANKLVKKLLHDTNEHDGLLHKLKKENISEENIMRIVVDLVLAAGDTTAYSMEWMLYLLSKNKPIQDKLRDCIKSQNKDTANQLLRNIMRESLRLYPVAPFLTRILPEKAVIGGYKIPAGTIIIMSIMTSGRDKNYFSEPELFLPDRWLRDNNHKAIQHASLPFAIGSRSCVGRKIAEIQLQSTLVNIVKNFNIELCNTKDVDVVLKMIAVPSEQIKFKFSRA